jgi:hypothetical protein
MFTSRQLLASLIQPGLSGIFLLLGLGYAATAQALTLNSTYGIWSNPIGGENIRFAQDGSESQIRWGIAVPSSDLLSDQSGLGFQGIGDTTVEIDQLFQVGTLRHSNRPVRTGTSIDGVSLTVGFNFAELEQPALFDFEFTIDETANIAGSCPYPGIIPCSDQISWVTSSTSRTLLYNDQEYTLELAGVRQGFTNDLQESFISQEGGMNTAFLFGRLTAAPTSQPVPESGVGVGLLTIALLGFGWRQRKSANH